MSTGPGAENTGKREADAPAAPTPPQQVSRPTPVSTASLPRSRELPPYRVLLHNDDFNEMRYVVRTIMELTRLDSVRAMEIMKAAHAKGAALVLVTHKERAELFKDQFAGKRLKVSIEPAS